MATPKDPRLNRDLFFEPWLEAQRLAIPEETSEIAAMRLHGMGLFHIWIRVSCPRVRAEESAIIIETDSAAHLGAALGSSCPHCGQFHDNDSLWKFTETLYALNFPDDLTALRNVPPRALEVPRVALKIYPVENRDRARCEAILSRPPQPRDMPAEVLRETLQTNSSPMLVAMTDINNQFCAKIGVNLAQLQTLMSLPDSRYYEILKSFPRDLHKDIATVLLIDSAVLPEHGSQVDSAVKLWDLSSSGAGPGLDALKREVLIRLHPERRRTLIEEIERSGDAASSINTAKHVQLSDTSTLATLQDDRKPTLPAKQVVITLHGIKTRGAWQKDLAPTLAAAGLVPVLLDYGYFFAIQLLWPGSRRRKVDWLRQEYQRVCDEHRIERASIIAHSFGTYLVARAMQIYDLKFDRIIFCGAIVRREYPWSEKVANDQVRAVLNDFGRMDFWAHIVAWVVEDSGQSGRKGFKDIADGRVVQIDRPEFRHGDYFYRGNYEGNWLSFLRGMPLTPLPKATRTPSNWRFRFTLFAITIAVIMIAYFLLYPLTLSYFNK